MPVPIGAQLKYLGLTLEFSDSFRRDGVACSKGGEQFGPTAPHSGRRGGGGEQASSPPIRRSGPLYRSVRGPGVGRRR